MGAAALPLVALAVGTGAQVYNTNRTARKQDETLAAGIRQQAGEQRRADQRVSEAIGAIEQSSPADAIREARQGYQTAIQGTEGMARAGQAISGLSDEYDAASRDASRTASGNVSNIADLLSRIDAPLMQRQNEGFIASDLSTDLGVIRRKAQGQDQLARLRASQIRNNPWIDAFAGAVQGYGSTLGGGTAGATDTTLRRGTGVNAVGNPNRYAGYA
jgi:hypothetical protein